MRHTLWFYFLFPALLFFSIRTSFAQSSNSSHAVNPSDTTKRDSIHALQPVPSYRKIAEVPLFVHGLYQGQGLDKDGSFITGRSPDFGDLVKVELPSGKKTTLAKANHPGEYSWSSVVSPDGKQVAYTWFNGKTYDLMLVAADGKSSSKMLLNSAEGRTAFPHDWTPDGQWLLVAADEKGKPVMELLNPKTGEGRVITQGDNNYIVNKMSFSPDGKYVVYDDGLDGKNAINMIGIDGSGKTTLVDSNYNNYGPYWSSDGKYILFLSNRHGRNGLWALTMEGSHKVGEPFFITEKVNDLDPIGFTSKGVFLYDSFKIKLNVYTTGLNSKSKNAEPLLISKRFKDNNGGAVWSRDGSYIAYKSGRDNNKTVIVLHNLMTGEERDIPIDSVSVLQWYSDNTLLVQKQKEIGFSTLYRLNTGTGDTSRLLELTSERSQQILQYSPVLSADENAIIFLESDEKKGITKVFKYDLFSKDKKELGTYDSPLVIGFAASPNGKKISAIVFYQGQIGRPSAIQTINLETAEKKELYKAPWGDETKLFGMSWSPDNRFIYYIRRNMKTSNCDLWKIPENGGEPQFTGITMKQLRDPRISPDGKKLAYYGGPQRATAEIWEMRRE